jgi:hypothetical protein
VPLISFDVESYTVQTTQTGVTANGAWRYVNLVSPALAHGIRTRAAIFFFTTTNSLGVVTNVNQPNFNGITAYAYCLKPDFAEWYDILRNERPLKCELSYEGPDYDPNKPSRQLYSISLYTGTPEPPGEGPEEVQVRTLPLPILEVLQEKKGVPPGGG